MVKKALDSIREAEDEAGNLLGVGLVSDWALLRKALQMVIRVLTFEGEEVGWRAGEWERASRRAGRDA
jgi:hypothetical protein